MASKITRILSKLTNLLKQIQTRLDDVSAKVTANKKEADDREFRQGLRDQNNVQSLVNLRESAQKAFNQVKDDIKELVNRDSKMNTRILTLETNYNDLLERAKRLIMTPAPEPQMPSDHVWVNKKLSGVYDVLTDLQKRLEKLERKAMPLLVNYLENEVRFLSDELFVGTKLFVLPGEIVTVSAQSYGLLITIKSGDQYLLCGGPQPVTMFLHFYKKAQ